jgi:hypothetical protein
LVAHLAGLLQADGGEIAVDGESPSSFADARQPVSPLRPRISPSIPC